MSAGIQSREGPCLSACLLGSRDRKLTFHGDVPVATLPWRPGTAWEGTSVERKWKYHQLGLDPSKDKWRCGVRSRWVRGCKLLKGNTKVPAFCRTHCFAFFSELLSQVRPQEPAEGRRTRSFLPSQAQRVVLTGWDSIQAGKAGRTPGMGSYWRSGRVQQERREGNSLVCLNVTGLSCGVGRKLA